jgi:hypothetical protein
VKILFLLLQQISSFISNKLFLTKVCLRVYNRQSLQRLVYRSRKGDSYGTEVVPKISLWSAVLNINSGNLIDYCPTWSNKKTSLKSVVIDLFQLQTLSTCRLFVYVQSEAKCNSIPSTNRFPPPVEKNYEDIFKILKDDRKQFSIQSCRSRYTPLYLC